VTAFFIPGILGDAGAIEATYSEMRRQVELDMGRPPSSRRIVSLWSRRGTVDCITQVGMRDPLRGGTVIAIFDMGSHRPFIVWWQKQPGSGEGVREAVGCNAYSVHEFDP
jgi:hypothetical protein